VTEIVGGLASLGVGAYSIATVHDEEKAKREVKAKAKEQGLTLDGEYRVSALEKPELPQ
jgi:hypothetical protein